MFDVFTPESRHSVLFAQRRAAACHKSIIGVADLVHGALADGVWASALLVSAGIDPDVVMNSFAIPDRLGSPDSATPMEFTPHARKALARAKKLADRYDHSAITTAHILVACLTVSDPEVDAAAAAHQLEPAGLAAKLETKFGPGQ